MDGVTVLTDPLLRRRVAHLRRDAAVADAAVAGLDAVLVSHLHMDHLDVPSFTRLQRSLRVVVPTGGAALLRRKGFEDVVEVEVGDEFTGKVVKTTTFGAFVSLMPGKDGLLHISKLRSLAGGKRVENVDDVVSIGQKVLVEISEIDARGKLSLSPVEDGADAASAAPAAEAGTTDDEA